MANSAAKAGPLFKKFPFISPNVIDGYLGGEVELIRGFAGSIRESCVGLMKYAIVCLVMLEFVTTRCSAPMSLPLLMIYIRHTKLNFVMQNLNYHNMKVNHK